VILSFIALPLPLTTGVWGLKINRNKDLKNFGFLKSLEFIEKINVVLKIAKIKLKSLISISKYCNVTSRIYLKEMKSSK